MSGLDPVLCIMASPQDWEFKSLSKSSQRNGQAGVSLGTTRRVPCSATYSPQVLPQQLSLRPIWRHATAPKLNQRSMIPCLKRCRRRHAPND